MANTVEFWLMLAVAINALFAVFIAFYAMKGFQAVNKSTMIIAFAKVAILFVIDVIINYPIIHRMTNLMIIHIQNK